MNPAQLSLVALVRLYRCTVAPAQTLLFGPLAHCRFTPSCSEFAIEAIQQHGAATGSWLALKRIARCHPWGRCGQDPVPPPTARRHSPACGHTQPQPAVPDGGNLAGFKDHRRNCS